jgi:putative transposase
MASVHPHSSAWSKDRPVRSSHRRSKKFNESVESLHVDFSRPGKPTDNALVESFNGRLRDECLNTNWFLSHDEAERKSEAWREHYNESRPHTALRYVPPREFARQAARSAGP